MQCEHVVEQLSDIVDGRSPADAAVTAHVEGCLRCQAELVQYRKLLKALHNLRTEVLEPAPGTLSGIFARIESAGERGAIRSLLNNRKAAYVGGLAVATAAAGAGAIVLMGRTKRRVRAA